MRKIQPIQNKSKAIQIKPLGETALTVQFGKELNISNNHKVKALCSMLQQKSFSGFIDCVPAFISATIFYNPFVVQQSYKEENTPSFIVRGILEEMVSTLVGAENSSVRTIEIPVCYGGEFGPDLAFVAAHNHLSAEEVIQLHTAAEYPVYMIGFAPGFPYLGGLSNKINAPRRSSPRTSIPAGSVGIAGNQTGVYPISTPGGWQLIGRTPLALFKPNSDQPSLLAAGDIVTFKSITKEEYKQCRERLE